VTILPSTIPIFPLFNTVLFPSVFLPLHIFEPRYRAMVADALRGDRIIGLVLLRPGWEHDYDGRPDVYPIGCAGLITHAEALADGRYNIILQGLEKFRILAEQDDRDYRLAHVEGIAEQLPSLETDALAEARRRLESALRANQAGRRHDAMMPSSMPAEELINGLSQYLELEPLERQALLERDGPVERCRSLVELLEMKVLAAGRPGRAGRVH
jgi:hypothetical protein